MQPQHSGQKSWLISTRQLREPSVVGPVLSIQTPCCIDETQGFHFPLPLHKRNSDVRMRLVSGPAGSGKTFRCLAEIRQLLSASPEGLPLPLIAPKQNTSLLARQLLSDKSLTGYTRLHIVSFERLAHLVFQWLGLPIPEMLDEQGRLM